MNKGIYFVAAVIGIPLLASTAFLSYSIVVLNGVSVWRAFALPFVAFSLGVLLMSVWPRR